MYSRAPRGGGFGGGFRGGGFGGGIGPVPTHIWWLLGVVFATFSLQFFAATAPLVQLLRLSRDVWRLGFVWQVATYPFAGTGGPSFWILIELLMLFWFGRDVYFRLGRKAFWQLVAYAVVGAAAVALVVDLLLPAQLSFLLMQGQRTLLAVFIAAFATLNREAVIYLFFVLPVRAKWFLPLEIVFAFLGFLGTHDLAGFLGVTAAVGVTWSLLTPGGLNRLLREGRLRLQKWRLEGELERLRRRQRKKGFRVIPGEGRGGDEDDDNVHRGPWVH